MSTFPSRREFMRDACGAAVGGAALAGGSLSWGAPRSSGPPVRPCLIVIYLRGGADPLSTIVPYADPEYRRHRPTLALSPPDSGDPASRVLPLDGTFGFNPHLKHLHALYEAGHCAPIVAVGSKHSTRSHFDAQDFMERGAPGQKSVSTGWLNRYLQATRTANDANLRAVSLQPLLPRSLRGDYPVLAKPNQKADQAMAVYSRLYMDQPVRRGSTAGVTTKQAIQSFGARTIDQLYELTSILESKEPPGAAYPDTHFGRQMRDLGKLVKARRGLEVTALDYGGWDHHIQEGPLNGQLARQLADVSGGIGAFADDVGPEAFKRMLILVMSEFGRTVKENDNGGTDHGHGGFMLAVGGGVRGKQVYGRWTGLADDQLYERRDLPVHTDFRAVLAESLEGVFGFDGFARKTFPDYAREDASLALFRA